MTIDMAIKYPELNLDFDIVQMRYELIRDEGVRFTPYKDSLGFWSIGCGHLLDQIKPLPKVWPRDVIYRVLDVDILQAYNRIKDTDAYKALETDPQRRALINMSFNLGNKLFTFVKFLNCLSKKQFILASNELINSEWFGQVHERANRIVMQIRST